MPGVTVERGDSLPAAVAPTSIGPAFLAGVSVKGAPLERVRSMGEVADKIGGREAKSQILWDTLDSYFHHGGSEAYIGRILGPNPTTAEVTLDDAGAADTLTVQASSPGEWGNALNVAIVAGDGAGEFKIVITHDTDGAVATSPSLTDKAEAFAWAEAVDEIVLIDEASANDPAVVAAQSLAGGADDRVNITDAERQVALDQFTKDLGPGQVNIPGGTTSTIHAAILDHCENNGRTAILDAPDSDAIADDGAALMGVATTVRGATQNERCGGMFWPWDTIPGLTPGTTRTVPPSGRIMGQLSALAAAGATGNVAAAGDDGVSDWAVGLSQDRPSDVVREDLNSAGINVSIVRFGRVTTYGWRTLADENGDPNWVDLGNRRLFTQIAALGNSIGETMVFKEIDGEGRLFRRFQSRLTAMLLPFWTAGSLYGKTQGEAFRVVVDESVNTPETIQNKEINADLVVKMSQHGEDVRIRVNKAAISEVIG